MTIDIFKLDMMDEWLNGAYDENGDEAVCDICYAGLYHDPERDVYYCRRCGSEMTRARFLDYIGANPPGPACNGECKENYPLCKQWCRLYDIDPHDPMLT